MKYWLLICTLLFSFCSCSDSELPKDVQKSKITAIVRYNITSKANSDGSEPKLLFTGDDIAWFNPTSREIKFTTVKSEPFSFPMYAQIDIKLKNETLFTIVAHINETVNRAYDDLVLFYDLENSKYYLYDNYPNYWSPETTEINRQHRKVNWNKFLEQLKKENRLK